MRRGGIANYAATSALLLALLLIWELVSRTELVQPYLLPPPSRVLRTLLQLVTSRDFLLQYSKSLARVLVGFSWGTVAGIGAGIAVSVSRPVRDAVYPLLAFLGVAPSAALVPLLMAWVGLNEMLPITAVFICTSIPLAYNTITGMRAVDPELIGVARTLGASRLKTVLTVVLPQSLPSIFSGLKIEAVMAWKTCFVAEALAMSSGLGYLLVYAQSTFRLDVLLAALLVLAASTYAFHLLFEAAESRLLRMWGLA